MTRYAPHTGQPLSGLIVVGTKEERMSAMPGSVLPRDRSLRRGDDSHHLAKIAS
ncbi:hypothetical protein [Bosea sp. 685]|uniref:hypothetical protein n=1 Tax=Bosea sp. 685 TaxID=3080057 RepID=UPI0028930F25|nr:hypothetical protein [Bosea sp. 685]WNJ92483.1 hypothetical protein RMR04_09370 [Bosea sp. 685]